MPSPFPGMDPYLEDLAFWHDFHRSFITYLRDAILERLPDRYDARIDEKIRLVVPDEAETRYYSDVAVSGESSRTGAGPAAVMELEPVVMTAFEKSGTS